MIDDETYFTQQHELTVYTQRDGEIEIPAFRIRFSGRKTFTSDPEPLDGLTPQLKFRSKRPPGTEHLGIVTAATKMETTQKWSPDSTDTLSAGDVLQRTIARRASGTTAMFMSQVSQAAPEGVRVYLADPIVLDRSDRGSATAERSDTIKYQFERAGTFTIPDMTFVWWDPQENKLRQKTLHGKTVTAEGHEAESPDRAEAETPSHLFRVLFSIIVGVCLVGGLAYALAHWLGNRPVNPEAVAARRLLSACRRSNASEAYHAFLKWKRIVIARGHGSRLDELMGGDCADFGNEVEGLARQLFGSSATPGSWSGDSFTVAFSRTHSLLLRERRGFLAGFRLPPLNPLPTD